MADLGIHANHQGQFGITIGDMLGGIAQRVRTTKLFEPDQALKLAFQVKEQISTRFKSIVGTVVDDRWQVTARLEDSGEMRPLRRG